MARAENAEKASIQVADGRVDGRYIVNTFGFLLAPPK
jgi:hypothetical protein